MQIKRLVRELFRNTCVGLAFLAAINFTVGIPMASAGMGGSDHDYDTRTPIKHVIVIIGENRTFDHIFATYQPKQGQTVSNLLSKGIIYADGTPGPNFSQAKQYSACDLGKGGTCPNTGETSKKGQPYKTSPHDKALYGHPPGASGRRSHRRLYRQFQLQ